MPTCTNFDPLISKRVVILTVSSGESAVFGSGSVSVVRWVIEGTFKQGVNDCQMRVPMSAVHARQVTG